MSRSSRAGRGNNGDGYGSNHAGHWTIRDEVFWSFTRAADQISTQVRLTPNPGACPKNPKILPKVQGLKSQLDKHSKQLEQSAKKLSQLEAENVSLRDENQLLNTVSNKKRSFRTRVRSMPTLETPNSGGDTTHPQTALNENDASRGEVRNTQIHDLESNSEPEPDQDTPEGTAAARSSMTSYLEQIFAKKFDAIQSMWMSIASYQNPPERSRASKTARQPAKPRSKESAGQALQATGTKRQEAQPTSRLASLSWRESAPVWSATRSVASNFESVYAHSGDA
ncbi:hypothetical protein Bca52824_027001 [Brassica carinata]|uniref:Uncharacterized protein n=1 Tax=Brassica carinata TaxID=52824 RepID=A0A8X7SHK8_BRACI|nr:hypothetical protein Bca52824_027001 [Brassica carinata]